MVLEATFIVIDNSEFSRNGDYRPTRYEEQMDTVHAIFQAKTMANRENTVGLLAYGGDGPQVLSTLTEDYGTILSSAHNLKISGDVHFTTGIQVAALALKHRQNKVQHQRIIAFIASPIKESQKELEKLAKKMKKNNIAIDLINYGEEDLNTAKLEKFISVVNSHENSHLVTVPPNPNRKLVEAVRASPILMNGETGAYGGGEDAGDGFDFTTDPNMDDELAWALQASLEEEQARQAREEQARQAREQQQQLAQQQLALQANSQNRGEGESQNDDSTNTNTNTESGNNNNNNSNNNNDNDNGTQGSSGKEGDERMEDAK